MKEWPVGYHVFWSEEDQEWVGVHDSYPSLSNLSADPLKAFSGIIELVEFIKDQDLKGMQH